LPAAEGGVLGVVGVAVCDDEVDVCGLHWCCVRNMICNVGRFGLYIHTVLGLGDLPFENRDELVVWLVGTDSGEGEGGTCRRGSAA
jgi:hypothetical protein